MDVSKNLLLSACFRREVPDRGFGSVRAGHFDLGLFALLA